MKPIVVGLLLALAGVQVQAHGRLEAYEICTSMTFTSGKNKCISALRNYEYFDPWAIDVCIGMSFDAGKLECIANIGDKIFDAYDVIACEKENSFDSGKNRCLKAVGQPF
ncbi:MAG TPA: hypothetical protein VIG33_08310 [Pseudobdellovibrionaceae bacterium]|jgi:hypothetical protein